MTQLIIFIVLAVSCIFLFRHALEEDYMVLGVFSFLGMVIGIIGGVFTAIEKDITAEWVEQPVSVVRTPRMVIVDDGKKTWEFTSYEDVVSINDSTVFLFEHTTNVFGVERIERIKYTNE